MRDRNVVALCLCLLTVLTSVAAAEEKFIPCENNDCSGWVAKYEVKETFSEVNNTVFHFYNHTKYQAFGLKFIVYFWSRMDKVVGSAEFWVYGPIGPNERFSFTKMVPRNCYRFTATVVD